MVKVPTYTPGQIKEKKMPGVRFSANATGASFGGNTARDLGNLGDALTQAGNVAMHHAALENQKLSKAHARDALVRFKQEADDFLFGDGKENRGLYSKQGKDASNATGEAEKAFSELRKKYVQELKDDYTRELFDASADSYVSGNMRSIHKFRSSQIEKFHVATLDAQNKHFADTAMKNRMNPQMIKESQEGIVANVQAKYKGYGKDVIDAAIIQEKNNLHSNILGAHANESPRLAMDYLNANWEDFDPKNRAALKEKLNDMVENEWVRDKAMALDALPLEKAMAQVDKVKDADKAAKLRRLVKDRYSEKQMLKSLEDKQVLESETDVLFSAFQKDDLAALKAYKTPMSAPGKDQEHLYALKQKFLRDALAKKGIGTKTQTNLVVWSRLEDMSIDDLRQVDLKQYIPDLNAADYKALFKKQRDGKGSKVTSPYQQLKIAVKDMGEFDPKDEEGSQNLNRLIGQMRTRLEAIPQKEITEEKIHDIIYKELLAPANFEDEGWFWFDREGKRYELSYKEEDKAKHFEENIPEPLKAYGEAVKFHPETERYYVQKNGIRKVFDKYGRHKVTVKLKEAANK